MSNKIVRYGRMIKKFLYFNGSSSMLEISKAARISMPVAIRYVEQLIASNEVAEAGQAKSSGGRRPQLYALIKNNAYVVSVWVDQLITRVAILNMENEILGEIVAIDFPLTKSPERLSQFSEALKKVIQESPVPKEKLIGVGIAMPGFVDAQKGLNHSFFNTGGKSMVTFLESDLGLPVLIDNDSSVIALAEHRFGEAKEKQNVLVVNIGWGIGLGIIQNGNLFRGHNGFAGEFSHIPLFTNNTLCACGKTGCLETETSLSVILNNIVSEINDKKPTRIKKPTGENAEEFANEVMQAALLGDTLAITVISRAAYHIGRGIAILVHVLNPELVVLSGIGAIGGKVWLAPIQQAITEHCIPKIAEHLSIKVSGKGRHAGTIGAAALIMDHYDELGLKKSRATVSND